MIKLLYLLLIIPIFIHKILQSRFSELIQQIFLSQILSDKHCIGVLSNSKIYKKPCPAGIHILGEKREKNQKTEQHNIILRKLLRNTDNTRNG